MLGDFINRCLILLLGYAYPGFECYKTVEKNRVDIEELRFWCKYWIIVALFTVLEKFADIFISWLPMYGETKLMLFIYMWYPKTKGSGYVYETVLRPIVSKHENDIDRKLMEWKARAWDFAIYYWQYCARFGHTAFIQILQNLASQSTRIYSNPSQSQQKNEVQEPQKGSTTQSSSSFAMKQSVSESKSKKWPPSPPSSPKSQSVHVHHHHDSNCQTEEEIEDEAAWESKSVTMDQQVSVKDRISRARARLRKLDSQNSSSPKTPQRRQL